MCDVRKIIIKNFTPLAKLSEEQAHTKWAQLEQAILAIQKSETCNTSMEDLYRMVDDLCTYNYNDMVTTNLFALIQDFLSMELARLVSYPDNFLSKLSDLWFKFREQVKTIKNIFLKYDRTLCNNKHNMIWNVSLNFFKDTIVLHPSIKRKLIAQILSYVQDDRDGKIIDKELIKSITNLFVDLKIYDDIFLQEFLDATKNYYKTNVAMKMAQETIEDYLKIVKYKIEEEENRVNNYLIKPTDIYVMDILNKFLILDNIHVILRKSFLCDIKQVNTETFELLYNLVIRVPAGLKLLEEYFAEYLVNIGTNIVLMPGNEKNMIQSIIDMKDTVDEIVLKSFKNNESIQKIVRGCFIQFINKRINKPAELLAKYIDQKLRCKESSEEETDIIINKVMVIFRFVQGKDIFEAFYKKDLAKRLLLGRSTSQDAENNMLSKLKQECGSVFTSKLEGMFKDIAISQSLNATFKQYLNHMQGQGDGPTSADLTINVLTSSYWPTYPMFEVSLPEELLQYQLQFQKFYTSNHSGRKLTWQPNLGHCLVKARFKKATKELQLSLFQAIVLLAFNDYIELGYSEIKIATGLEEKELKRTLLSLACGKSRVLIKNSKGIEISETDLFSFNEEFANKLYRVKINEVQLKETVEEQKATEESVLHDRQFQIDAAVVRIMKQKKVLSHNALISELFAVLNVPVKPADLKKRIEQLIEREYIKRDDENPYKYNYVA